ncbi:MAG: Lin0512 family protein, partial [Pseudomonadota bacterium]
FRHSSLPLFKVTDLSTDQMVVQVTVGVQEPDKLDIDALTATLPRGRAAVTAVRGGLNVPAGGETIVIAQAAVEAFVPPQTGWVLKR